MRLSARYAAGLTMRNPTQASVTKIRTKPQLLGPAGYSVCHRSKQQEIIKRTGFRQIQRLRLDPRIRLLTNRLDLHNIELPSARLSGCRDIFADYPSKQIRAEISKRIANCPESPQGFCFPLLIAQDVLHIVCQRKRKVWYEKGDVN